MSFNDMFMLSLSWKRLIQKLLNDSDESPCSMKLVPIKAFWLYVASPDLLLTYNQFNHSEHILVNSESKYRKCMSAKCQLFHARLVIASTAIFIMPKSIGQPQSSYPKLRPCLTKPELKLVSKSFGFFLGRIFLNDIWICEPWNYPRRKVHWIQDWQQQ